MERRRNPSREANTKTGTARLRPVCHALFLGLLLGSGTALARPPATPLGPSIVDTGSTQVETRTFTVPSPDGSEPAYRISVLVPRAAAPRTARPCVYLLDGQAALEHLTDDALAALPRPLPVIVTVGYDTNERFPVVPRTRDYTPTVGDEPPVDPLGRRGGGSAAFLDLLQETIVPQAEGDLSIDADQRTIWGHSYGGLLVLEAARRPTSPFARFVAASPSLWWEDGAYLSQLQAQLAEGKMPRRPLTVHVGAMELVRKSGNSAMERQRAKLEGPANEQLVEAMRAAGVPTASTTFPAQDHGQTFPTSLLVTLGKAPAKTP